MSRIPLAQAGMAVRLTLRKKFLDSQKSIPKVAPVVAPPVVAPPVVETVGVQEVKQEPEAVIPEPMIPEPVVEKEPEVVEEAPLTPETAEPEAVQEAVEPTETKEEAPTWSATSTKAELVAAAEKLGIEVPSNASKASILKLLSGE